MTTRQTSILLAVAFVVGLVVSPVGTSVIPGSSIGASVDTIDPADPPWSQTTRRGCERVSGTNNAGWLVSEPGDGETTFYFNASFVNRPVGNVSLESAPASGIYVLNITPPPDDASQSSAGKRPPNSSDCVPTTGLQAGVSLPADYSLFSVMYDGETVVSAQRTDDTTPRVWKLNNTRS